MLLLTHSPSIFERIKSYFRKKLPVQTKKIEEFWNTQSGDWHWLAEKPIPIASLNRDLWRASVPSLSYHFLLGMSGIIATFGLLGDSVAIIIGAMIIAPLIGPIVGIAYSASVANRRLLRRSTLTLFTGVTLTIAISWLTAVIVQLKTVGPEIVSRSNPTLIDLGIALAAGAAGAFANSRRRIADALPGVAIAVALVPPLSVIGIGLALGEKSLTIGSSLLFLTNLTGIVFSGLIVFLCQSYGSIERAKQGLIFSIGIIALLGLPLTFSLRTLIIQKNVRYTVNEIVRSRTPIFSNSDIRSIEVKPQSDYLLVEMEVASADAISRARLEQARDLLAKELERPVELRVKVIPIDILEIPQQPL
ncbi:TIGR00341 family protein [Myxosarcina sp. GI1]|uniref:TIGR00341 family protein n=1 Tax=Myxosarcina sp. GI1 TaxID=1541065 RepID=UPI00068D068D|nr:TIGR00341 family protein [Myxosarcina sp. GI1]